MARKVQKPARQAGAQTLGDSGGNKSVILAAALKAFANDTFEGASIPEIARAAGIGGPLVYYHFGSKENLWRATVDYAFEKLQTPFDAIVGTAQDLEPRDVLKMLCRALAKFSMQYPEHVLVLMNEIRSPGPRLSWVTDKYLKRLHDVLDDTINLCAKNGQIKAIPAVFLTNAIVALMTHFYSAGPLIRELYDSDPMDPSISAQYVDHIFELVFKGIEPS